MKISFREGVSLRLNSAHQQATLHWTHITGTGAVEFKHLTPGMLTALQTLASEGAINGELTELVEKTDGILAGLQWQAYLTKFDKASLLKRTIFDDGKPLVTLTPKSPFFEFKGRTLEPDKLVKLSRFAYWHCVEEQLILESPLGYAQLVLHENEAVTLIGQLRKPSSYREMAQTTTAVSPTTLAAIFNFLLNASVLTEVDAVGRASEEKNVTLRQWEFHDLLFHTQSRLGRTLEPVGGIYRFWGEIPSLPAVKPPMSTHRLPLFRPDVEQLQREDMPFAQVMERRKSVRKHGRQPIADKQLGEFLYRFARVTELYEMALTEKGHTEKWSMTKRPYPSGGGRYSLELYVTVDRCEYIPSAFYHYYPLEHALYKVSERTELVERLLALGRPNPYEWQENPQVLITIAARFQRLFWKYKGFAYAVLLKESGILTQSMYLVATAMGLAPCEVGIGDAELFARIAGTDYYAETCIGEFTLGSMPDDDQTGQSDAPV